MTLPKEKMLILRVALLLVTLVVGLHATEDASSPSIRESSMLLGEDRVSLSMGLQFLYATRTKNTQGFIRDFGGILVYGKSSPFSALQTS